MIKSFLVPPLIVGLVLVGFQQIADPEFDAKVARPAYTATHPKVLIDEAHRNFHTAGRGYKPFADLLTNDGCQVLPNKEKFQESALQGVDVLVIANALGAAFSILTPENPLSPMRNATPFVTGFAMEALSCSSPITRPSVALTKSSPGDSVWI